MISQYIKDSKNHKRGMLVATENEFTGRITIGWSLCNKKDKFDKDRALSIATGRSAKNRHTIYVEEIFVHHVFPDIVRKEIESHFINRVAKYFRCDWQTIQIA